ncbi:hypothetical protein JSO62_07465 [Riemerella anatipestifer]|uniref:hypothetical protein n=1 Tax=Riemerella anatipestifer TaxID=34085 RepID=UPI0030BE308A
MKVTKTTQEEISKLNLLLNEIEWLSNDFRSGKDFSNLEWEGYKRLEELPKDDAEEFLKVLCHKIAVNHFQRVLMNCSVLLENCADENEETLEFNPEIKLGFEAVELLKEIHEYTNNKDVFSAEINEKLDTFIKKQTTISK